MKISARSLDVFAGLCAKETKPTDLLSFSDGELVIGVRRLSPSESKREVEDWRALDENEPILWAAEPVDHGCIAYGATPWKALKNLVALMVKDEVKGER